MKNKKKLKYIDLFAGLGGIRLGFTQAFEKAGYETECVLTSEIKPAAIKALSTNFGAQSIRGDITTIDCSEIPDFDFLLAGFPCQAFSVAGRQKGFMDTRGTLFFEVERILKEKRPYGFILENVEGLVTHDRENPEDKIGRTFSTILHILEDELKYQVSWKVLDSQKFGLAQSRNRIYIVGTLDEKVSLSNFKSEKKVFKDVMEIGLPTEKSRFTELLFDKYKPTELYGKAIKDKRGGIDNIHSWDVELRGHVTDQEKDLLNALLKERRKKHWAEIIGIDWMDGMPLTSEQIRTFFDVENLEEMLADLVDKGYVVLEHPKKKVIIKDDKNARQAFERIPDTTKPQGYNIVSGKLSFDFTRILSPEEVTPTLVAMDMATLGVIDCDGLRHLSLREGLRLFGYPDWYSLDDFTKTQKGLDLGYDLLGNTVCVPVIQSVATKLAEVYRRRTND
ncbi:MAG: DNA (cytosine-5-)-methyltransferase [Clostridia bacterium]|jgi:DNA (cytosine-5)-methyltransferase 1|uniref:DNA (cytosine-5-)-methyltransferase n=1 Tax=Dubosiella newyorkensis TaxID=1862672 RepID=UPI0025AD99C3|nr:DNA (cytosine-5-)-methyltransferase [Dubosiella newyorkensis]MCI9407013.1 DNA (cytosine-5-)-methyltransferase [Clostridia bacterium]